MKLIKQQVLPPDKYRILLENSLQSIPFNIVVAGILAVYLYYKNVPKNLILIWLLAIVFMTIIRWAYSQHTLNHKSYKDTNSTSLIKFISLTLLMGGIWGVTYGVFLPYMTVVNEVVVILIMGGMAAGAATSLAVYLPAFFAFMLPMFIPIIIYNYSLFQLERSMLATMCLVFFAMVAFIARINNHLLQQILSLNNEKDFLIKELSITNKKLEESNDEIRAMSITDHLTGLYNRRYFDNALLQELSRSKRNKYPLGLILIDIDNFKYINDTYGHPYGDSYLIFVANTLKNSMRRANDILVRLGGDEFAAILANMTIQDVKDCCDTIRTEFAKNNKHNNVTLSIGIISIEPSNSDELKNIISAADRMLYMAKEMGKNQTISQIM